MNIGALIEGSNVAITGGTGTLGNALTTAILPYRPNKLVILNRSESRQAEMKQRWPEGPDSPMRYLVRDVREMDQLLDALEGIQIVIHAAALKRVEVCDREPKQAVLTNILGTLNAAEAARQRGVERFIFTSSDKCCAAATMYGGTKYVAERLTIGMNNYRGQRAIRYSAVRYGNVLGSTGSVIHAFRCADGKLPITHPDMSRFWLTPAQAAEFVLSSLAIMRGGETFIPKLPSMRIVDLARAIAPCSEVEIVGLRGAEKLHESMLSVDEAPWVLELPDRYVLLPAMPSWSGGAWPEAKPVPAGWSYNSGDNDRWLTSEELLEMLGEKEREAVHAG